MKNILEELEKGEDLIAQNELCQKSIGEASNNLLETSKKQICRTEASVIEHNNIVANMLNGEDTKHENVMCLEDIKKLFPYKFPIDKIEEFIE